LPDLVRVPAPDSEAGLGSTLAVELLPSSMLECDRLKELRLRFGNVRKESHFVAALEKKICFLTTDSTFGLKALMYVHTKRNTGHGLKT
jgi:hypothetical protein